MKIFIICSKQFYSHVPAIRASLEEAGHNIVLPNSFEDPLTESRYRDLGPEQHSAWKADMLRLSENKVKDIDAVLVLNFEKNGVQNYVGGATFLEMYDAFRHGKQIFLYNDIPKGMLFDEITGFNPIILNGDINLLLAEIK